MGRGKIILEEREASRRSDAEKARRRERDLANAIAAVNEAASQEKRQLREVAGPRSQLGVARLAGSVREAAAPEGCSSVPRT